MNVRASVGFSAVAWVSNCSPLSALLAHFVETMCCCTKVTALYYFGWQPLNVANILYRVHVIMC